MQHPAKTINYQVAFSMGVIWVVAMGLLIAILLSALLPQLHRIEEQQMRQHLVRAISLVQSDLKGMQAFAKDWSMWDDAYNFMADTNPDFVRVNLLTDAPMRDFELNVMSFIKAQGYEKWTRIMLPGLPPDSYHVFPAYLDKLKLEELPKVDREGVQGLKETPWGPLLFCLEPITNSAGTLTPNGYFLVARWLDEHYLRRLSEKVALPMSLTSPQEMPDLSLYTPLGNNTLFRLGYEGWRHQWGEVLLLDDRGNASLQLRLVSPRDMLLGSGQALLIVLAGTLLICLLCGLVAFVRLQSIVLRPLHALMEGVQRYHIGSDPVVLPLIDSSHELGVLSRKIRDLAVRLHLQHRTLQLHSQRMEEAANLDPLTQCFNRRYLDSWQERLEYRHQHLLVLTIDLDYFKQINDRHGHDTGDLVLIQFADLMRSQLRHDELLVRLGGEEFLVVCECRTREQARAITERLQQAIAMAPFGNDKADISVTASMGFSLFPPGPERHAAGWALCLKLADMAVYRAKTSGRNTWVGMLVEGADPLPSFNGDELQSLGVVELFKP